MRRPERSESVPGEGRAAAADGYTINDGDNETHCLAVVTQDHGYGHIAASASSAPASRRSSPEWANAMTGAMATALVSAVTALTGCRSYPCIRRMTIP